MERYLIESGMVRFHSVVSGVRGPIGFRYQGIPRAIYLFYSYFSDVSLFIALITVFIKMLSPGVEFAVRCTSCFPGVVLLMSTFQHFYLYFFRPQLAGLMQGYVDVFPSDPGLAQLLVSTSRYVRILPWLQFCLTSVPMAPFCLFPLFKELQGMPRILGVPATFPFDHTSSSTIFILTTLFQTSNAILICMRVITFDNIFYSYANRQITLTRHLSNCLHRILSYAKVNLDGQVLFKNAKGEQFTKAEASEAMKAELKDWIIKHQTSLRLAKELQRLYSPPLIVQFFLLSLQLCTNAFVVVAATNLDIFGLASCLGFCMGNMIELLLTCRLGDLMYIENQELAQQSIGTHLHCLPKDVNRIVRVILTRLQVSAKLSVIGVFPLDTDTFRSIAVSAYSYFTMLNKLKN